MSEYNDAALMFDPLPWIKELIADDGSDGDWFRQALAERDTTACIS